MFGIGWSEFLVILVLAVVLIGPKDLPRLMYSAGKLFRKFKVFTADIQVSIDKIVHEEELSDIVKSANKPGGENLQFMIDEQAEKEKKSKLS
jgi:sec-independent protein translocase protein TatB